MASVNRAIIIGRLGRDPELKFTPSGQAVANFSVATDETYTGKDGQKVEKTEWHRIVAWGKTAEFCENYLSKGRKVLVVGRLQTRSWEADGVKKQRTEIVATDINFLSAGPGEGGAPAASSAKKSDDPEIQEMPGDDINLDDIPF